MTMQQVLEAVRGLGERFDRHAKRLRALEAEAGMEDDPDDDNEKEPKDPNDPDTKMDPTTKIRIGAGPPGHQGRP